MRERDVPCCFSKGNRALAFVAPESFVCSPPPIRPCTVPGYPKVVLGTPTQGPGSPKERSWEPQGGPGHPKVRSWVPQGKVLGTPGSPWTLTKFPASTLQEAKHSVQPSTRADFLFFSF